MQETISTIVASFGAGISFLVSIALFSRKKLSFLFLGVAFFSFFLSLFEELLWSSKIIYQYVHFAEFSEFSIFLIAPSLFLYAKFQFKEKFKWIYLLHYLPAILALMNFLPFFLSDEEIKSCYIIEELLNKESINCKILLKENMLYFVEEDYLDYLHIIQFVIYLILVFPYLKLLSDSKAKKVQGKFLSWANIIIFVTVLAFFLILLDIFIISNGAFSIIYLTIIVSIITYKLLVQSILLQDNRKADNYNTISKEDAENIIDTISMFLKQNNAFQDSQISIEKISKELGIPRNKIIYAYSQVETDFREELNKLRIEKAKELLTKSTQLTIEAVGNEVGYSSKATFYKYFKKYQGETPNRFLSQL